VGRIECEPIVTKPLFDEVVQIMEEQRKTNRTPGKVPTHTFSNLAWCACGGKMYVRTDCGKYLCRKCNNKIPVADIEGIFHGELEAFFTDAEKIAVHMDRSNKTRSEKEQLLGAQERAIQKVRDEMADTHRLFLDGHITPQGFGQFYKPAEERLNALTKDLPKLQAEVDYLKVNQLTAEAVVNEAHALYTRWPTLPVDEKRKIAESVCQRITVGRDEIDITLSYLPSSEEACKNQQLL
jgi:site-specific DNA recombinase